MKWKETFLKYWLKKIVFDQKAEKDQNFFYPFNRINMTKLFSCKDMIKEFAPKIIGKNYQSAIEGSS